RAAAARFRSGRITSSAGGPTAWCCAISRTRWFATSSRKSVTALAAMTLTGDCASDPPLSATLRAVTCARADDVLLGLGALAVAAKGAKLRWVGGHFDAEEALREAAARLSACVEIVRLPDAWPPNVDGVDARVLVAASPSRRDQSRYLTVAGAVREPVVMPV